MKKYTIFFVISIFSFSCCWGQAKAAKKLVERISTKSAKKAAYEAAKKRTYNDLVAEGVNRTGRKYTGEALGKQIAKRAVREHTLKMMEKEGFESFLEFGRNKARKGLEQMNISQIRKEILAKEAATATRPSSYHSAIERASRTLTRTFIKNKNQYVSKNVYVKYISKYPNSLQKTGHKDAKVLRNNMLAVMGKNGKYAENTLKNGNQAHHIIGEKTPKAAEKLKSFGIDINDPMNGIFLPSNIRSGLRGTVHRGGHSQDYYDYIEQMFSTCQTKDDCYEVLDKIKNELYKGKIKLYSDQKHYVNKTFN